MATKPLEGILVVSLEQAVAGPLATARLAAAGARVIKIERPEGDFARGYDLAADGISSYFAWSNQGKESIALDLKEPDELALLKRMVDHADVFLQNLAVGAAARMGLDAPSLHATNPGLVVCDVSGYGADGPYAEMKAYDLLVQAESGLLSISGPPGPYGRVGVSLVDGVTGYNAAIGIMEALYRKARTGEGAHLETSLFACAADLMTVPLLHFDYLGKAPERIGLAHPSVAPYGGFQSGDGETVVISIQSDREWRSSVRHQQRPCSQSGRDRCRRRRRVRPTRPRRAGVEAPSFADRLRCGEPSCRPLGPPPAPSGRGRARIRHGSVARSAGHSRLAALASCSRHRLSRRGHSRRVRVYRRRVDGGIVQLSDTKPTRNPCRLIP